MTRPRDIYGPVHHTDPRQKRRRTTPLIKKSKDQPLHHPRGLDRAR